MYMTLFCCLLFGFCHCWDFFYLFSGVGLGGGFLKKEASSKPPPHFTPTNLFAFFKKKKKKKDKKPPPSPAVCTQALPPES